MLLLSFLSSHLPPQKGSSQECSCFPGENRVMRAAGRFACNLDEPWGHCWGAVKLVYRPAWCGKSGRELLSEARIGHCWRKNRRAEWPFNKWDGRTTWRVVEDGKTVLFFWYLALGFLRQMYSHWMINYQHRGWYQPSEMLWWNLWEAEGENRSVTSSITSHVWARGAWGGNATTLPWACCSTVVHYGLFYPSCWGVRLCPLQQTGPWSQMVSLAVLMLAGQEHSTWCFITSSFTLCITDGCAAKEGQIW